VPSRRGPAGVRIPARVAAVAVAAFTAMVVAACSGGGAASPAAPGGSSAASLTAGPTVGSLAPGLALTDLDGRPVSLADYRGRPVVLNYWASWCGPCRDEFPALKAAQEAHAAAGLAVLGVLFKDDPGPAKDFIAKEGATWTTLADPDGTGAATFRVVAPPTTFFIDADGVVRDLQVGGMTPDQLDRHLGTILP
jgi:cytochrome c biogenesis protein CcmG/thiol:disulfide interchange protein DsbE